MNTKDGMSDFGHRLKEFRQKKGYTQEELADLSGISRRMIGHYETLIKRPSLEKIEKIAKVLDVSIDDLLGLSKPNKDFFSDELIKKLSILEKFTVKERQAVYHCINKIAKKYKAKDEGEDEDED